MKSDVLKKYTNRIDLMVKYLGQNQLDVDKKEYVVSFPINYLEIIHDIIMNKSSKEYENDFFFGHKFDLDKFEEAFITYCNKTPHKYNVRKSAMDFTYTKEELGIINLYKNKTQKNEFKRFMKQFKELTFDVEPKESNIETDLALSVVERFICCISEYGIKNDNNINIDASFIEVLNKSLSKKGLTPFDISFNNAFLGWSLNDLTNALEIYMENRNDFTYNLEAGCLQGKYNSKKFKKIQYEMFNAYHNDMEVVISTYLNYRTTRHDLMYDLLVRARELSEKKMYGDIAKKRELVNKKGE